MIPLIITLVVVPISIAASMYVAWNQPVGTYSIRLTRAKARVIKSSRELAGMFDGDGWI